MAHKCLHNRAVCFLVTSQHPSHPNSTQHPQPYSLVTLLALPCPQINLIFLYSGACTYTVLLPRSSFSLPHMLLHVVGPSYPKTSLPLSLTTSHFQVLCLSWCLWWLDALVNFRAGTMLCSSVCPQTLVPWAGGQEVVSSTEKLMAALHGRESTECWSLFHYPSAETSKLSWAKQQW